MNQTLWTEAKCLFHIFLVSLITVAVGYILSFTSIYQELDDHVVLPLAEMLVDMGLYPRHTSLFQAGQHSR